MVSDDITQAAWAIVAEHLTGGQKDPTLMVADGIRQERERWTAVTQAGATPPHAVERDIPASG